MNKLFCITLAMLLGTNIANAQEDKPWFDIPGCDICKSMMPLMDSMHKIKWDSKPIHNGMISISAIPADLKDKWEQCKAEMESTIKKIEGGDSSMKCCGFCDSFGGLIAAGAKKEELQTTVGEIVMLTSDDPAIVKRIHEHVKKTMAEHVKMEQLMKANSDPQGHHDDDGDDDDDDD